MFTDKVKNEIEDKILSYCEGITHVEFNINDIGKMINDIENVVKNNDLLHNVSNQRELLIAFKDNWSMNNDTGQEEITDDDVDDYLSNL